MCAGRSERCHASEDTHADKLQSSRRNAYKGTYPNRFTSNTLYQLSMPLQDVPLGAIAALFMSTPTWQSSRVRSSLSVRGPLRRAVAPTACARGGARSTRAHLAPCLVHLIAQTLDLLELAHVRGDGEHVDLADDLLDLGGCRAQARLVYVCDRELEPDPARCELIGTDGGRVHSLGELNRGCATDSAACAGDDRDAAGVDDGMHFIVHGRDGVLACE